MKTKQMENRYAGIWIDHTEAMIVTLIDGRPVVEIVRSNAEKRRHHRPLNFYDMVIEAMGDEGHLYIFGPDQSKDELAVEIEKTRHHHYHIDMVEAADKLTENQVVAKVKNYFEPATTR
jgi:hypothetical protein